MPVTNQKPGREGAIRLLRALPPEPHPIDYDWRFDASTVCQLCNLVDDGQRVLAFGAPSVARSLESAGKEVVLIDRQPDQGVTHHLVQEIGSSLKVPSGADIAIVDPPWYPMDFLNWAIVAARSVGIGKPILLSIWPPSTRPTAAEELQKLQRSIAAWASVQLRPEILHYERPLFEQYAQTVAHDPLLATSPRVGNLLELTSHALPEEVLVNVEAQSWQRFTVNDYQLALRLNANEAGDKAIAKHPGAIGWSWPYVSARAPDRNLIDLWSSHGEVAVVQSPNHLASVLRRAFLAIDAFEFEAALSEYPNLIEWDIPRPPYWRFSEWNHRQ